MANSERVRALKGFHSKSKALHRAQQTRLRPNGASPEVAAQFVDEDYERLSNSVEQLRHSVDGARVQQEQLVENMGRPIIVEPASVQVVNEAPSVVQAEAPQSETLAVNEPEGLQIALLPHFIARRFGLVALIAALVMLAAFVVLASKPTQYKATAELLLDPAQFSVSSSPIVGGNGDAIENSRIDSNAYVISSNRVLRQVYIDLDLASDPFIGFNSSSGFLGQSLNEAGLPEEQKTLAVIENLKGLIDVGRLEQSFVFQINAKHPVPETARDIANSIASNFLALRNQDRRFEEEETAGVLADRAASLLEDLRAREAAVEGWLVANGLGNGDDRELIADQGLSQLYEQLVSARVARAKEQARLEQARALDPELVIAAGLPESFESPVITGLRQQLSNIAQTEAELSVNLGPRHPRLQVLENQRNQLETRLQRALLELTGSVEKTVELAASQVAAIEGVLARQQDQNAEAKSTVELAQLKREASIARQLYEDFQNSSRQLSESSSLNLSKARLVSAADTPVKPSGLSRLLVLFIALIFGACAGAGLSVLVEMMRGSLMARSQIINAAQLPIVASLPAGAYSARGLLRNFWMRVTGKLSVKAAAERSVILQGLASQLNELREEGAGSVVLISSNKILSVNVAGELFEAFNANGVAAELASYDVKSKGDKLQTKTTSIEDVITIDAGAGLCALASGDGRLKDMIVVDMAQGVDNAALPQVLHHADRILLLSQIGKEGAADLQGLASTLLPWREKLAGIVTVGVPVA